MTNQTISIPIDVEAHPFSNLLFPGDPTEVMHEILSGFNCVLAKNPLKDPETNKPSKEKHYLGNFKYRYVTPPRKLSSIKGLPDDKIALLLDGDLYKNICSEIARQFRNKGYVDPIRVLWESTPDETKDTLGVSGFTDFRAQIILELTSLAAYYESLAGGKS